MGQAHLVDTVGSAPGSRTEGNIAIRGIPRISRFPSAYKILFAQYCSLLSVTASCLKDVHTLKSTLLLKNADRHPSLLMKWFWYNCLMKSFHKPSFVKNTPAKHNKTRYARLWISPQLKQKVNIYKEKRKKEVPVARWAFRCCLPLPEGYTAGAASSPNWAAWDFRPAATSSQLQTAFPAWLPSPLCWIPKRLMEIE